MLPKSGDTTLLANWRPIAILRITYKIFSRLIYQRLMPILNNHQSGDQVGFRPNCSVEDVFIMYETVVSKCLEWNLPLWTASLDLRKAFDRIEYHALFQALHEQGIDNTYVALLAKLYADQSGHLRGSQHFAIERGVKQGDIISPLLFNAGLEMVMRKWKSAILGHGIQIDGGEHLTNIR